jgi:hypothetical protein
MVILALFLLAWFVVCTWLYRVLRSHAWLAGSSTASCAFFLGATVACGFFVVRAAFLVPLGIAVTTLLCLHIRGSRIQAPSENPHLDPAFSDAAMTRPIGAPATGGSMDNFSI